MNFLPKEVAVEQLQRVLVELLDDSLIVEGVTFRLNQDGTRDIEVRYRPAVMFKEQDGNIKSVDSGAAAEAPLDDVRDLSNRRGDGGADRPSVIRRPAVPPIVSRSRGNS